MYYYVLLLVTCMPLSGSQPRVSALFMSSLKSMVMLEGGSPAPYEHVVTSSTSYS